MDAQEIIELLKTKEKRLTKAKREMIDIFLNTEGFINVNDLRDKLSTEPDMSTIYRNLESFCEIGFLEKIQKDDRRWYKVKEDYSKHNHYISCKECGKKKVLDFCPIILADRKVEGFDVTGHQFELVGICSECKEKEAKNDK